MKIYQLKQRLRLGGERFDIKNEEGQVDYQVEGSFLSIPKTFTVYDGQGQTVSVITKEILTWLPRFEVKMVHGQSFSLKKKLTFLKDRYEFENLGLTVVGDIWDWNFSLLDQFGQTVAEITKEFFHLTSTYQLTIYQESYADLVISLAVAIDYVEMLESRQS
ncbi:LURP-one-related/scramblase family protein [Streptococcus caprae]|uniref:LURP-one-related/scramblase family protein n=1 Tax=Streptococcus caprae TaxID=1640501 RepID=A0ABV8CVE1_9STRE